MKIGHRLLLGNIVIILAVITIGVSGLVASDNIINSFESSGKHFRSIITAAMEVSNLAKRAEGHLLLYLSLHEDIDREKFYERYNALLEEIKILNHATDMPEAKDLLEHIRKGTADLFAEGEGILRKYDAEMAGTGRFDTGRYRSDIRKFNNTVAEVRQAGTNIAVFEAVMNEDTHRAALKKASRLQYLGFFALLTGITISLIQGYVLFKNIAGPISKLREKVSEMTGGNLDVVMEYEGKDEIGDLTSSFNTMAKTLKESRHTVTSEKERLLVTLRSIGDGVITTDTDSVIALMNKSAEAITGWTSDEAVGRKLTKVFRVIDKKTGIVAENPAEKALRTGQVTELSRNNSLIRKDGAERIISDSGAPIIDETGDVIGAVLVFRDITERQIIEEELLRARHMESIGLLAGGIAHDFNNILVGILGNTSLARKKLEKEEKAKVAERLAGVEHAALRAKDLAYQLLTFSKGGAPVLKTTLIDRLIEDSAKFALSGSNIICSFSFAEDLMPVDIDRSQLSQVIHNLAINAKWAMPQGGRLDVRAENILPDRANMTKEVFPAEKYVKISIKDDGIGISPDNLPKIFDPYFTTKSKGSGLGLATVYSIIKRHGGHITAESAVGEGTTFHIYLPGSGNIAVPEDEKKAPAYGKGRVLVMDDEDIVRDVTDNMLTTLGYEPVMTVNGTEAINQYKEAMLSEHPFSAVILDLTIPGNMGGRETIQELLKIDPEVKAIVASGYSADPVMGDFVKYGFRDALKKPYTLEELSLSIHKILS